MITVDNHFGLGYPNDETIMLSKWKLMPSVNLQQLASESKSFGLRISMLFTGYYRDITGYYRDITGIYNAKTS